MRKASKPILSKADLAAMFADQDLQKQFPPLMTLDEAANLLRIPKATLYDWRSRGLLASCSTRVGKHVRLLRDKLLHQLFNEDLQ